MHKKYYRSIESIKVLICAEDMVAMMSDFLERFKWWQGKTISWAAYLFVVLGGNDRPIRDGQLRNLRVVNIFIIVLTYLLTFLLAYLNLINILIIYGPYVIIRMLHWEPGVTCLVGSIFRNKKWFSCSICSNFGICECGCRGACSSRASSSGMGMGGGVERSR